jgi:hypothetical protein
MKIKFLLAEAGFALEFEHQNSTQDLTDFTKSVKLFFPFT